MLAQGQSFSAIGGGLAAVSSGLIFLKRKKKEVESNKRADTARKLGAMGLVYFRDNTFSRYSRRDGKIV